MKRLAILGSTGSIGTQALEVVRKHPDLFKVSSLAANSNHELMARQIEEFSPQLAVLADEGAAMKLKERNFPGTEIAGGKNSLSDAAAFPDADLVVTAMTGFSGLAPTLAAINAKKTIALANKETLVAGGEIVIKLAREKGAAILPVDSEHSAIFQCLNGEEKKSVKRLIITASGGPFRGRSREELKNVSISDALSHPTWSMGKKITVDSATLINKGLETIEAHWLFDMPYEKISAIIHPESIIHSMVEYSDGAVIAQLGAPDMRLPIEYALSYPERIAPPFKKLDLVKISRLTFEEPDAETFQGLSIAVEAGKAGGIMPCVMNAANEEAVVAFLAGRIGFLDIYECIKRAMDARENKFSPSFETLLAEDEWARGFVRKFVETGFK